MSLQGSRPRKLVRKTSNNNPTFNSYLVMEAFNPQSQLRRIQKQSKTKQLRSDSLNDAERRYDEMRSNVNSPFKRSQSAYNKQAQNYSQLLNRKLELYQAAPKITQGYNRDSVSRSSSSNQEMSKLNRFYNYMGSNSIKTKQYHGFNIISGIPGYNN